MDWTWVLLIFIVLIAGNAVFILFRRLRKVRLEGAQKYENEDISILERPSIYDKVLSEKQEVDYKTRKEIIEINKEQPRSSKIGQLLAKAEAYEKSKEFEEAINEYTNIIDINQHYLKAWQGLEKNFRRLDQYERIGEVSETIDLIQDIIEFENNAKQKLELERIEISKLPFFSDSLIWAFESQINILLGKNGYGKSYLMQLVVALLQKDKHISKSYFTGASKGPFVELSIKRDGDEQIIHRSRTGYTQSIGKIPVLAIPDSRFIDKSSNDIVRTDIGDLRDYGAFHFLYDIPYQPVIMNFLYKLCTLYMDEGKSFKLPIFQLIERTVSELTDTEFKFKSIKQDRAKPEFIIEVLTEGTERPLPIQKASQGTLSVLAIFGLIYYYIRSVFPDARENEILEKPCIVFIDELDAHLHPSWHQKIIGLLRNTFPNTQFIVTAHSPLIIAGCLENEVSVLRRKEDGFDIEQFQGDFIGAKTSDLYKEVFETEDIDATYQRYDTESSLAEDNTKRIDELESKKSLKPSEEKELYELSKRNYYIKRVNQIKEEDIENKQELKIAELEAKIRDLELRLKVETTYKDE